MTTITSARPGAHKPTAAHKPTRRRRQIPPFRLATSIIVAALVVVQVYPLAWLFMTSLRTESDFVNGNPFALPSSVTLDNYARAFGVGNLGLNIVNSFIVTFGASAAIVIFGMMAAYALQVLGFREAASSADSSCSASSCPFRSRWFRSSWTTRRWDCSTPICR